MLGQPWFPTKWPLLYWLAIPYLFLSPYKAFPVDSLSPWKWQEKKSKQQILAWDLSWLKATLDLIIDFIIFQKQWNTFYRYALCNFQSQAYRIWQFWSFLTIFHAMKIHGGPSGHNKNRVRENANRERRTCGEYEVHFANL